jgi:membrane protein implicated in regulation of membrane protease activity
MSASRRGLPSEFGRATEALIRTVKSSIIWPLLVVGAPMILICIGTMPWISWPLNLFLFALASLAFVSLSNRVYYFADQES